MNEFRERWPDRRGFIFAVIGVSLGLMAIHPLPGATSGAHLVIWLCALLTMVLPTLVLELALGMIFQGALTESLRKSEKRLEAIGWFACAVAFCALVFAGAMVGEFGVSGYACLLATAANQPLPWAPQLGESPDAHLVSAASPVALAVIIAIIDLSLWRGAPSIARIAVQLVPSGLVALLILAVALVIHPGAIDGLTRWLTPDARGWSVLFDWHEWLATYGYTLSTWLLGLGIYSAFGSYLNRSSDITGLAGVAVFGAALAQMLLMLVIAIASGLTWNSTVQSTQSQGTSEVVIPTAIANLDSPIWLRGVLASLWFLALLAFSLPALLAIAEAVVAPIVDKFRIARERVVAGVCLAAFFCSALIDLPHERQWAEVGDALIFVATSLLVLTMCVAAWYRSDLDAMQRHLNAYSAIRVGLAWRSLVRWIVPLMALAVAGDRFVMGIWHTTGDAGLARYGMSIQIGIGIFVFLAASAFVLARLPARGT